MVELIIIEVKNNQNNRDTIKEFLIKKFGENCLNYKNNKIPFLNNNYNISISNKNNKILIGLIEKPTTLGIDLEDLTQNIEIDSFKKNIINKKEEFIFSKSNLSNKETLILIWSIKEAFFKLIGKDFDIKQVIITKFKNYEFRIKYKNFEAEGNYIIKNKYVLTSCYKI